MSDYLRLLTAITVAKCEREGLPVPKHDLTDAEREAGHAALDDAERLVMERDEREAYRVEQAQEDERLRDQTRAPWDR